MTVVRGREAERDIEETAFWYEQQREGHKGHGGDVRALAVLHECLEPPRVPQASDIVADRR